MRKLAFAMITSVLCSHQAAFAATSPATPGHPAADPVSKEFVTCVNNHIALGYTPLERQTDFRAIKRHPSRNYVIASPSIRFNQPHQPITPEIPFSGILEGCNATIENLEVQNSDAELHSVGFFSSLYGQVRNLTFESPIVIVEPECGNSCLAGVVAGKSMGGTLQNVRALNLIVDSSRFAGGLVGYQEYGSILDSFVSGTVIGSRYVGGIAGYAVGSIHSSGSRVNIVAKLNPSETAFGFGGLVGTSLASIFESFSEAHFQTIGAQGDLARVGGLVGRHATGSIRGSYALADFSDLDPDQLVLERVGCFSGTTPTRTELAESILNFCVGNVPPGAAAFAGHTVTGEELEFGISNIYDSSVEPSESDFNAIGVPTPTFLSETELASLDWSWAYAVQSIFEVSPNYYPTLRNNQFD